MAEGEATGSSSQEEGLYKPFLSKPSTTWDDPVAIASPDHGFNYGTRPWKDIPFLVVFVIVCLASIGLGIFAVVNHNPDFFQDVQFDQNQTCQVVHNSPGLSSILAKTGLRDWDDDLFLTALISSVVGTLVLSVPLVWGLLWLLRNYAKELVYASLPFLFLAPVLLNITWFVYCLNETDCQEALLLSYRITAFLLVFVFCGFLLWVIWAARSSMELAIMVIRTASESLNKNLKLLFVLPGLFLSFAVFFVALVVFAFFAYANGKVVVSSPHVDISDPCIWKVQGWVPAYLALAVLALYWSTSNIEEIQSYVIAGTVSQWYFAPANSPVKGATVRSLRHAFGPSSGTICFAGLIVAIVRMVRAASRNARGDRGQGLLSTIVRCCLELMLRIVEFVTNFTITFSAITGEDFCKSAHRTYDLLKRNALSTLYVDSVAGNLLGSIVFVTTIVFAAVVFGVLYLLTDLESGAAISAAFICWLILAFVLTLFARVLTKTVDTVYICYALDKDSGNVSKEEVHSVYLLLPSAQNEPPSLAVAQP